MFEKLNPFLDSLIDRGVPGFDCRILKNGKEIYRRYDGFSDREAQIPMNGKELYNFYSCSKVITCAATLKLLEEKAYSLDDELYHYLPEFKDIFIKNADGSRSKCNNHITIRQLFTMTSGLDYDLKSPSLTELHAKSNGASPTREVCRCIAAEGVCFEPGTDWKYGLSHDVLAGMVEVITGENFNEYLKARIFRPFGMNRSTYNPDAETVESLAAQYRFDESGVCNRISKNCEFRLGSEHTSGGAGLVSSLEDYMLFMEALRQGEIIKPETLSLMTTNQLTTEQLKSYVLAEHGYGLGVRCPMPGGRPHDFGWDGAAGSFMAIEPELGVSICYTQHVRNMPFSPFDMHRPEMWQ